MIAENFSLLPQGSFAARSPLLGLNENMDRSVSIIVTTYNYGAYVSQAIESLINQEGNLSLENIVVDDGSTDNTRSILESYAPPSRQSVKLTQVCQWQGIVE